MEGLTNVRFAVFVCAAIQIMLRLDKKKAARAAEAASLDSDQESRQRGQELDEKSASEGGT